MTVEEYRKLFPHPTYVWWLWTHGKKEKAERLAASYETLLPCGRRGSIVQGGHYRSCSVHTLHAQSDGSEDPRSVDDDPSDDAGV